MPTSIFCPHCLKHTALSIAPTEYEGDYGRRYHTPAIWENEQGQKWWIGVCNSCQMPCLVLNRGQVIYPDPMPSPTDPLVPKDLARDLDEAKKCFSVGCFRACAAMARRVAQLACIQKGAKKSNLVEQIAELSQTGVITKDIGEWATVVRWIGNDAAHPNKDDVTKEDAEDCLKLAEQFLYVIFVTPAIAKARRAAKGK
jgi:hypothetical protein